MSLPSQTIPSNRAANNFTELRFPMDIGPIGMAFRFSRFSYENAGRSFASVPRISSTIVLPLPQNIEDNQGVVINQADLGITGALAAEGINALQEGSLGDFFGGMAREIQQTGRDAVSSRGESIDLNSFLRGGAYLARRSLDNFGVGVGIEQATGTAINPHTALQFDGVPLKEFQFNWQLAPKNSQESSALQQIENTIKKSILPSYAGLDDDSNPVSGSAINRAFLNYPDICDIEFFGIDPNYYFAFKPGMISSFNINYSPQGNVILKGGKPGIVNISMVFKEARIHTRQDYGGSAGAGGGVGDQNNIGATAPGIFGDGLRG